VSSGLSGRLAVAIAEMSIEIFRLSEEIDILESRSPSRNWSKGGKAPYRHQRHTRTVQGAQGTPIADDIKKRKAYIAYRLKQREPLQVIEEGDEDAEEATE